MILFHIKFRHFQTAAFSLGPEASDSVHDSPLCLVKPLWFSKPGVLGACLRCRSLKVGVPDVGWPREELQV